MMHHDNLIYWVLTRLSGTASKHNLGKKEGSVIACPETFEVPVF